MSRNINSEPAYLQVQNWIKSNISTGHWRPGDSVPSEHSLSQQFGLSRQTVNRAIRELASQGIVIRVQGSGTTVAELHRVAARIQMGDIFEEIATRGHTPSTRVITLKREKTSSVLAQSLNMKRGAPVFHSLIVFLESGVPIQLEDRYVNPTAAPNYLEENFSQVSPTRHLLKHAPLTEANYHIEACLPTPFEANALQIESTQACLCMTRKTRSGPNIASIARQLYPSSRYSFEGQFQI